MYWKHYNGRVGYTVICSPPQYIYLDSYILYSVKEYRYQSVYLVIIFVGIIINSNY